MDITEIPFSRKVGIERDPGGRLTLAFDRSNTNHLETIHASALFALAESASGEALMTAFPELIGKVVPVVRNSKMKFRKPATEDVTAFPSIGDEAASRLREQLARKGRSSIEVKVEVRNRNGDIVCIGSFDWFVQS